MWCYCRNLYASFAFDMGRLTVYPLRIRVSTKIIHWLTSSYRVSAYPVKYSDGMI
jgi:hypothetical protein